MPDGMKEDCFVGWIKHSYNWYLSSRPCWMQSPHWSNFGLL